MVFGGRLFVDVLSFQQRSGHAMTFSLSYGSKDSKLAGLTTSKRTQFTLNKSIEIYFTGLLKQTTGKHLYYLIQGVCYKIFWIFEVTHWFRDNKDRLTRILSWVLKKTYSTNLKPNVFDDKNMELHSLNDFRILNSDSFKWPFLNNELIFSLITGIY